MRTATVERNTKETQIAATLCLDGGEVAVSTGNGFFDHMLTAFAVHGGFGLQLTVQGDLEVDTHHTVEDTGIVLGQALRRRWATLAALPGTAVLRCRWTKAWHGAIWICPIGRFWCFAPHSSRNGAAIMKPA